MNGGVLIAMLGAAFAGFAIATPLIRLRLRTAPPRLMRTNVSGRAVPAVLGEPLAIAALVTLALEAVAGAAGWEPVPPRDVAAALALVIALMALAGVLDDRRGDEASRGFKGHVAALARGRITGGMLKILAGVLAGAAAGGLLFADDLPRAVATALLVAGGANTINLFDRAPGRAGKVTLLVLLPLMALGHAGWAIAAAGLSGALVAALPADLAEEGMLGDAGANPLGAALGLGLAISLTDWALWVAVAVVIALNVASERWSFSKVIADHPWLDSLDRAGRK